MASRRKITCGADRHKTPTCVSVDESGLNSREQAGGHGNRSPCVYDHSTRLLHTLSSKALRGILYTQDGSRGLLVGSALASAPLVTLPGAEAAAIVASSWSTELPP
eukprot:COSAG02_NODE_149_length_33622_cov_118.075948_12_plen_106_part_00